MPSQVTNYKCPACTGPMHYAGDSGRLECEYCGSSYSVEEVEKLYADKDAAAAAAPEQTAWDTSGLTENWGKDGEKLKTYSCPSCGAQLICDDETAATSCPYCGNPTIVPGQFTGALKPDFVLPFRKTKDEAVAALRAHYKGKKLLPSVFTQENHIKEIKGVYVPFWLFDAEVDTDLSFHATRSNTMTTQNERITQTEHFDVRRAGTVRFEHIPVDASKKMPDEYMDSVEPFDYADLKPFSTAYLPGYLADIPDVDVEECSSRADRRAINTALEETRSTVSGYDTLEETGRRINLRRGAVHYGLLPVWMLSTRWNGENYIFAVNGQTGKTVGDLPVSAKKYWTRWLAITAGVTVIGTLLVTLLGR